MMKLQFLDLFNFDPMDIPHELSFDHVVLGPHAFRIDHFLGPIGIRNHKISDILHRQLCHFRFLPYPPLLVPGLHRLELRRQQHVCYLSLDVEYFPEILPEFQAAVNAGLPLAVEVYPVDLYFLVPVFVLF